MEENKGIKNGRFQVIPEGELKCVWMNAGVISYKLCHKNYECDNCLFDRVMRDESDFKYEGTVVEKFLFPAHLTYHQGHTWVKLEGEDIVRLGIDDFAQRLLGRVEKIELPSLGSKLHQNEKAWTFLMDSEQINMLSPVDGKVIALNESLEMEPGLINDDPYRLGWFLKVHAPRLQFNMKNLLAGDLGRKWMEKVTDELLSNIDKSIGPVRLDGGAPVSGMAKALDKVNWHRIVRKFFRTE